MFISYLLHYVLTHTQIQGAYITYFGVSLACLFVALVGLGRLFYYFLSVSGSLLLAYCKTDNENCLLFFVGRIYLGMHSLIDVVAGLFIGLGILGLWLTVDECIDSFVISGKNGIPLNEYFSTCCSLMLIM